MSMDMSSLGQLPGLTVAGLWAVFLLGVASGFGHCLGMCGPLIGAASFADGCATVDSSRAPQPARRRAVRFQLGYHAGRLITYTVIGALLGLLAKAGALAGLGSSARLGGLTVWVQTVAGIAMVTVGALLLTNALRGRGTALPEPTRFIADSRWFVAATTTLSQGDHRWGLGLGMLMGMLPCMPLLPAELAAIATGEPLWGALTMLAFGLGTLPALVGLGAMGGLLGTRARGTALAAAGAIVVVLGFVVTYQGLMFALGA
jgi:sulfite exporter TauE/SafE